MCSPSTNTLREIVESLALPIHDPLKVDTCPAALIGSMSATIAVIRPRVSDFIGGLSHDEDFALRDLHDIDPAGDGKDCGHVERQRERRHRCSKSGVQIKNADALARVYNGLSRRRRNAEKTCIVVGDTILRSVYVADGFGHRRVVWHRPGDGAATRRARVYRLRDGAQTSERAVAGSDYGG